jgi:Asp-tRNA(Asn)/Glu-tRNA(Gln) amidotransferase A subunit family amidase
VRTPDNCAQIQPICACMECPLVVAPLVPCLMLFNATREDKVALNRRSRVITDGDARAANRAMLYPVGFTPADFGKPIVGVPHGHSTMLPCNAGILSLVDRAVEALRSAGAMPQTWGFPTASDGISMGTEGMRYSLPSREEIARCIQIGWGSHQMDGLSACWAHARRNLAILLVRLMIAKLLARVSREGV